MIIEIISIEYILHWDKRKKKKKEEKENRDIIEFIISYSKWNIEYNSIQDRKILKTNFNSLKYCDEAETIVGSTNKQSHSPDIILVFHSSTRQYLIWMVRIGCDINCEIGLFRVSRILKYTG